MLKVEVSEQLVKTQVEGVFEELVGDLMNVNTSVLRGIIEETGFLRINEDAKKEFLKAFLNDLKEIIEEEV